MSGATTLRSPERRQGARILGVGGYRPRRVVPNSEIIGPIDSSDEWIRSRSGIIERRFADDDETLLAMSVWASEAALTMAGIAAAEIDNVILATFSYPFQTPALAPLVAAEFGLTCPALDISAACAGYTYGIALAADLVRSGSSKKVLVIGVERLSDFLDERDRGTAFIFGDGAGAAIVGGDDVEGIGPTVWGSDGSQGRAIRQRDSWLEVYASDGDPRISMEGPSVFRWAVTAMGEAAQQALDAAGVSADQLDAFIPHQANVRIIDAMAKKLGIPDDVPIARDIAHTGNTSAASIPLAMERMINDGEIRRGGLALQIGFGAGLAYAGQVVRIP